MKSIVQRALIGIGAVTALWIAGGAPKFGRR